MPAEQDHEVAKKSNAAKTTAKYAHAKVATETLATKRKGHFNMHRCHVKINTYNLLKFHLKVQ